MSEPIRLIAIDMDGTLLRSDKTVDPQTAEDIRTAAEKGIHIAYCTGRGTAEMQDTFRALPMIRYAVLTSGAVEDVTKSKAALDIYLGKDFHM